MLLLTISLLVCAAPPVAIEPLGFSVRVTDGSVVVVSVTPGSVAATAGLTVGLIVERLISPHYLFASGPLAELSAVDLRDALTPPHDEPLLVMGRADTGPRMFSLVRTDPRPANRFPELPLPPEKLARLSLMQQANYHLELQRSARAKAEAAKALEPVLVLEGEVDAEVDVESVRNVIRGASTPDWIYLDDRISFRCPSSPMRSIELAGPAPVTKVIATSVDRSLRGASVPAQIPLWRVRDAVAACRRKETSLPSVKLLGTLRCEGEAPRSVELSKPLTLRCVPPGGKPPDRLDGLRIRSLQTLLAGSTGPTTISVWWRGLRPTPLSAVVLELDPRGAVAKRHQTLTPPSQGDDTTEAVVAVDRSSARSLALALEVKFPDGSIERGPEQKMRVVTQAQQDAETRAFDATLARLEAVKVRLGKAFDKPCAKPDETVKWLLAQPEVSHAANHEGHNLSYLVDDMPFIVMCHERH